MCTSCRYVRGAVVERNEFKWVGDSAIVLLGRTMSAQPCNARCAFRFAFRFAFRVDSMITRDSLSSSRPRRRTAVALWKPNKQHRVVFSCARACVQQRRSAPRDSDRREFHPRGWCLGQARVRRVPGADDADKPFSQHHFRECTCPDDRWSCAPSCRNRVVENRTVSAY